MKNLILPNSSQQERRIQELTEKRNSILLVATHNNNIIGNVDLRDVALSLYEPLGFIKAGIQKEYN
ncbi:MAG: hypothetical protein QM640_13175 [Niabella sp.]